MNFTTNTPGNILLKDYKQYNAGIEEISRSNQLSPLSEKRPKTKTK
jgi:hypothetical protein